jgi:PAS domain S-box-containing protein
MTVTQSMKHALLGTVLLAIALGAILSYHSLAVLLNSQSWVQHTLSVLAEIRGVEAGIFEAGLGARRFVSQGDESDAAMCERAIAGVNSRLDQLQVLTSDNPRQQERILRLRGQLANFLQVTIEVLHRRRLGDLSGSAATLSQNQPTVDSLLHIVGEMVEEEQTLLRTRIVASQQSSLIAKWGLLLACILNLGFVVGFSYVIHRDSVRQQQLWESRSQLARVVESSDDAIISKTLDGHITSWNKGAERLYGYSAKEVIGHSVSMLAPEGAEDEIQDILSTVKRGERVEHRETERVAKDGRRLQVSLTVSPIYDAAGNLTGAGTIARDFTAQHRAETQLRQAQKLEAVARLAAGIAHDFNNILSIVVTSTELLRPNVSDAPLSSTCLENIEHASKRGAALTRQLLSFSRRQVSQPTTIELTDHLRQLAKLAKPLMGDDVEVVLSSKNDMVLVKIDAVEMDQIIMNLAVNARDAMPRGGRFALETSAVKLDDTYIDQHGPVKPGEYALLAVSDTGVGMDQETLSRIFDPFFTTKEMGGGTGLGLSTVYGIVNRNGGHIWAYSEPGRGTTFKVYLPLQHESDSAASTPVGESVVVRELDATLLLVDDDPVLRSATQQLLEQEGYTVFSAENGKGAIAWVASHPGQIDLLLTDVIMPGMSGPELMEVLRVSHPGINVIYMSGYLGDRLMEYSHLESARFVEKPFTKARLLNAIHATLVDRAHHKDEEGKKHKGLNASADIQHSA